MTAALLLMAVLATHAPPDDVGYALLAMQNADRNAHARGQGVAFVEAANGERLDVLLTKFGWPKRTRFGAEATHAAFVLAMHARVKPARRRAWLALLEAAVAQGEAEASWAAQLRARVERIEKD